MCHLFLFLFDSFNMRFLVANPSFFRDLEPIGRRATGAADLLRAYEEKHLFGYQS
jgi:hypothetical protein